MYGNYCLLFFLCALCGEKKPLQDLNESLRVTSCQLIAQKPELNRRQLENKCIKG